MRGVGPPNVIQFKELDKPTPKENEVLIRIHSTTVISGDWRMRSFDVPIGFGLIVRLVSGVTKPRQPILARNSPGKSNHWEKTLANSRLAIRFLHLMASR